MRKLQLKSQDIPAYEVAVGPAPIVHFGPKKRRPVVLQHPQSLSQHNRLGNKWEVVDFRYPPPAYTSEDHVHWSARPDTGTLDESEQSVLLDSVKTLLQDAREVSKRREDELWRAGQSATKGFSPGVEPSVYDMDLFKTHGESNFVPIVNSANNIRRDSPPSSYTTYSPAKNGKKHYPAAQPGSTYATKRPSAAAWSGEAHWRDILPAMPSRQRPSLSSNCNCATYNNIGAFAGTTTLLLNAMLFVLLSIANGGSLGRQLTGSAQYSIPPPSPEISHQALRYACDLMGYADAADDNFDSIFSLSESDVAALTQLNSTGSISLGDVFKVNHTQTPSDDEFATHLFEAAVDTTGIGTDVVDGENVSPTGNEHAVNDDTNSTVTYQHHAEPVSSTDQTSPSTNEDSILTEINQLIEDPPSVAVQSSSESTDISLCKDLCIETVNGIFPIGTNPSSSQTTDASTEGLLETPGLLTISNFQPFIPEEITISSAQGTVDQDIPSDWPATTSQSSIFESAQPGSTDNEQSVLLNVTDDETSSTQHVQNQTIITANDSHVSSTMTLIENLLLNTDISWQVPFDSSSHTTPNNQESALINDESGDVSDSPSSQQTDVDYQNHVTSAASYTILNDGITQNAANSTVNTDLSSQSSELPEVPNFTVTINTKPFQSSTTPAPEPLTTEQLFSSIGVVEDILVLNNDDGTTELNISPTVAASIETESLTERIAPDSQETQTKIQPNSDELLTAFGEIVKFNEYGFWKPPKRRPPYSTPTLTNSGKGKPNEEIDRPQNALNEKLIGSEQISIPLLNNGAPEIKQGLINSIPINILNSKPSAIGEDIFSDYDKGVLYDRLTSFGADIISEGNTNSIELPEFESLQAAVNENELPTEEIQGSTVNVQSHQDTEEDSDDIMHEFSVDIVQQTPVKNESPSTSDDENLTKDIEYESASTPALDTVTGSTVDRVTYNEHGFWKPTRTPISLLLSKLKTSHKDSPPSNKPSPENAPTSPVSSANHSANTPVNYTENVLQDGGSVINFLSGIFGGTDDVTPVEIVPTAQTFLSTPDETNTTTETNTTPTPETSRNSTHSDVVGFSERTTLKPYSVEFNEFGFWKPTKRPLKQLIHKWKQKHSKVATSVSPPDPQAPQKVSYINKPTGKKTRLSEDISKRGFVPVDTSNKQHRNRRSSSSKETGDGDNSGRREQKQLMFSVLSRVRRSLDPHASSPHSSGIDLSAARSFQQQFLGARRRFTGRCVSECWLGTVGLLGSVGGLAALAIPVYAMIAATVGATSAGSVAAVGASSSSSGAGGGGVVAIGPIILGDDSSQVPVPPLPSSDAAAPSPPEPGFGLPPGTPQGVEISPPAPPQPPATFSEVTPPGEFLSTEDGAFVTFEVVVDPTEEAASEVFGGFGEEEIFVPEDQVDGLPSHSSQNGVVSDGDLSVSSSLSGDNNGAITQLQDDVTKCDNFKLCLLHSRTSAVTKNPPRWHFSTYLYDGSFSSLCHQMAARPSEKLCRQLFPHCSKNLRPLHEL